MGQRQRPLEGMVIMELQLDLSLARLWEERIAQTAEEINARGLPLVLFGCVYYPAIEAFLSQLQVEIICIWDNDPAKQGQMLYGLPVTAPSQLEHITGQAYRVLILVPFEAEIRRQLEALPLPPRHIDYLDFYFYTPGEAAAYIKSHRDEVEQVFHMLADRESREVYQAVLRYWLCRGSHLLRPIALPRQEQYFPDDLFALSRHEVLVDGGAFTGDTAEAFIRRAEGQYQAIHAFEPDEENYRKLERFASNHPKVHPYRFGLGKESATLFFSSDGSSSKVDESGSNRIAIEALDQLLGPHTPVTYLKLDVEGAECAALQGAEKLIRRNRPKLAVCTYHSIADMVQVPLLIRQIEPDYYLYFRHYTHGIVETVCYAMAPYRF